MKSLPRIGMRLARPREEEEKNIDKLLEEIRLEPRPLLDAILSWTGCP